MYHRNSSITLNLLLVIFAFASTEWAIAQKSDQFRTEYGNPDLQGVWNFSSNTPMQRNPRFADREFLNPNELQEVRARLYAKKKQAIS